MNRTFLKRKNSDWPTNGNLPIQSKRWPWSKIIPESFKLFLKLTACRLMAPFQHFLHFSKFSRSSQPSSQNDLKSSNQSKASKYSRKSSGDKFKQIDIWISHGVQPHEKTLHLIINYFQWWLMIDDSSMMTHHFKINSFSTSSSSTNWFSAGINLENHKNC